MNNPLLTNICGVELKNPVIAASGVFGYGAEYNELFDVSILGGIAGKGLTLSGSAGNRGERICETPSGMLNSIGLQNNGVKHFVEVDCAQMRSHGCAVIANLGGHCEQDYTEGARLLNDADIDLLELNISCPNVRQGGMAFGMNVHDAFDVTRKVKDITRFPLVVKLTPNAPDVVAVARACASAGADALSLVNTFLGMAIDLNARKPFFDNVYAGLSGPAIRPIALRLVHQVAHSVDIPVIGMGGIASCEDALAFIMAGARAVQVGAAIFSDYTCVARIIDGLRDYCVRNRLSNIGEICGIV
ncbi:MAG: dihydroorotate dehydrogenase [Clostridia bacterium]|nr:dihydroorotate dehydrogenase [Clostridia bacterium]